MGCGASKGSGDHASPEKKTDSKDGAPERRGSLAESGASIRMKIKIEYTRVMDDEVGLDYMLDFAKSELSEENITFWMDAMKFKRMCAQLDAGVYDTEMVRRPPVRAADRAAGVRSLPRLPTTRRRGRRSRSVRRRRLTWRPSAKSLRSR